MATVSETREHRVDQYVRMQAARLLLGNLELEVGFEDDVGEFVAGRVTQLEDELGFDRTLDEYVPAAIDARVCALVAEMLTQVVTEETRERALERATFFARQARERLERGDV